MTPTSGADQRSELAADRAAIRPFRVNVPEAELAELRRRINATRWPERETVTDTSQGVQLATMQKLARYWATDYDWRKCEARLNALPQFITEIDGLDIHFIHVRSKHEERAAAHRHARMARLDHRAAEDHRSADQSHGARRKRSGRVPSRDSVDAGLRVLRQADHDRLGPGAHRTRMGRADAAPGIHEVRGARWRLGRADRRHDGRRRLRRNCSAFTPTCPARCQPTSRRRCSSATRRQPVSRPREAAPGTSSTSSTSRASPTPRRWRPARRRCTGSRIRPSAWPRGCSTTTPRSYELIARVFDGTIRGPDARRHPRQHHALLADEHGDLFGSSLLGEQAARSSPRRTSPSRSP